MVDQLLNLSSHNLADAGTDTSCRRQALVCKSQSLLIMSKAMKNNEHQSCHENATGVFKIHQKDRCRKDPCRSFMKPS